MSAFPRDRLSGLLTAARESPHYGLGLLSALPPLARAEAIRRWCLVQPELPAAPPGPGLKKCGTRPAVPTNGLAAELAAFSRSVGRVGTRG
jgi:hypothetical protein